MDIAAIEPGHIPEDQVAPDSLSGISRQQTNPSRRRVVKWNDFVKTIQEAGIDISQDRHNCAIYITDAGGLAHGFPHGVIRASSAEQISTVMAAAQRYAVPVTTRGGGLTTEGEAVAFGGLLLDMSSMNNVLNVDCDAMTVRTEAGIFWHQLAEVLRRDGMDYLSAPLNMTSTVGGVVSVGGIDINSPKFGCSADQVLEMKVVTPKGEIKVCSEHAEGDLFEKILLGYGQFGVIVEATLKIRKFTPLKMHYYYYSSLRKALEDLQFIVREEASDYSGILTIMDRAVNLLVAFDSEEKEKTFLMHTRKRLRGYGEIGFAFNLFVYYLIRPWKIREALYLMSRRFTLFPELHRPEFMKEGKIIDRTALFSRAVWKFWGGKKMVIPDLSANEEKFVEAVERGNAVCRKYFKHYTLYCVGIRKFGDLPRYEMSCMPKDAEGHAYGCEFEPMLNDAEYSRDYLQSFKNEIYDIGVDMNLSYYRFGGMMKGYIRRIFSDELVEKHLRMKKEADPKMILNRDVIF